MTVARLRNVGGSVMMTIPKSLVDRLGLAADDQVTLSVEDGRLILVPRPRPRYTLEALLAQCDLADMPLAPDAEWLDAAPVGREAF